jgi:hypothetical protein
VYTLVETVGNYVFWIVVGFFGFWVLSKFFANIGKLREEGSRWQDIEVI